MYDDIFLFVKLVNLGNFRKLAGLLDISQSTISRRIVLLEKCLNIPLLKHDTRSVVLTDEGEALYNKFCNYETELANVLEQVTSKFCEISGTLRIALQPTIAMGLITSEIPKFQQQFPGITLIIKYVSDRINMLTNNYDVAVSSRMPESQSSKLRLLTKLKLRLFATPEYANKHGLPTNLNELQQHTFVGSLNDDDSPMTNYLACNEETSQEQVHYNAATIFTNNMLHALIIAKNHSNIVAAWDILTRKEISCGELKLVLPEYNFGEFNCYLIKRDNTLTRPQTEFIKFIERCFTNQENLS